MSLTMATTSAIPNNMDSSISKRKQKIRACIMEQREKDWYVPPALNYSKFDRRSKVQDAATARELGHNPTASIRHANALRKERAFQYAEKGKGASDWIHKTVKSNFVDTPLKLSPDIRAKAMNLLPEDERRRLTSAAGDTTRRNVSKELRGFDIMQKIFIRENMLEEIKLLVTNNYEMDSSLEEIINLMNALRFLTVDVIEGITKWKSQQSNPSPFWYRGENYILKVATDLDYLDEYEALVAHYGFEFKFNPFAYKNGGTIIVGTSELSRVAKNAILAYIYDGSDAEFINGMEISRIKKCERRIQKEYDRMRAENVEFDRKDRRQSTKRLSQGSTAKRHSEATLPDGDLASTRSGNLSQGSPRQQTAADDDARSDNTERNAVSGTLDIASMTTVKPVKASRIVPRITEQTRKQERILKYRDEIEELIEGEVRIDEKVKVLVKQYESLKEKKIELESMHREAIAREKTITAQKLFVDVSLIVSRMQSINDEVKGLQRQAYFLVQDRRRRTMLSHRLQDELSAEKKHSMGKQKGLVKIHIGDTELSHNPGFAGLESSSAFNTSTEGAAESPSALHFLPTPIKQDYTISSNGSRLGTANTDRSDASKNLKYSYLDDDKAAMTNMKELVQKTYPGAQYKRQV